MAIWKAHKEKCAYCGELIPFNDLEIDHILPESLLDNPEKLEKIKLEYGLGSEFDINNYSNWLPSCSSCNNRKRNRPFSESSTRFYREMVARPKYEEIKRIEQNLETKMKKEGFLTKSQAIPLIEEYIKDFVVNNLIISPATKRRDQWINEYLSKAVQTIAEKATPSVVENLSNNEFFLTVVIQATSIALRNHQKEKLKALRNVIVNSILSTSVDDDIKLLFLDLVDELKISQLCLLYMLDEPSNYRDKEAISKNLEGNKYLYSQFLKQLINKGLISFESFSKEIEEAVGQLENNYNASKHGRYDLFSVQYFSKEKTRDSMKVIEETEKNVDLAVVLIKENKSCTTEFGSLFIQFIKSPLGDS